MDRVGLGGEGLQRVERRRRHVRPQRRALRRSALRRQLPRTLTPHQLPPERRRREPRDGGAWQQRRRSVARGAARGAR